MYIEKFLKKNNSLLAALKPEKTESVKLLSHSKTSFP